MKKILLLLLAVTLTSNLIAQNIPNGGFENWTSYGLYEMPDSWKTTDSISVAQGMHSATKETVDKHGGSNALKLTPFTYAIFTIPGVASNGIINTTTFQIIGGTQDTIRHTKLTGWYKYAPVSNDSCTISVTMYKWNGTSRDIVGAGIFGTSVAAATYTPFDVNISYASGATPDSMLVTIYSSVLNSSHLGTVLLVDDLTFTGITIGINEVSSIVNSVHVYPNPAVNELNVELDLKKHIKTSVEIFDINGKKVQSHPMSSLTDIIDITELKNGNYFYYLQDENGNKMNSGKFSVSK